MPRMTNRHAQGSNSKIAAKDKQGGSCASRRQAWDAKNYIRSLDSFAKEVPAFNIQGQSQVQTLVGGCITLLIMIITFSYATSKMIDLSQKKDPFITQSVEKDFYDPSKGLNLNKANFRIAIGATNYDGVAKNDPRYIKWFARLYIYEDG